MKQEPFQASCVYHIYNRGNNRENIFKSRENYVFFMKLIKKYLLPIIEIYAYCLLPNHFHLLVRFKENEYFPKKIREGTIGLHQPFSNMFNAYAKAINKKYRRTGSLFQKQFKRKRITNEDYLKNLIVYINTNPSHHSIADYSTYEHSSYYEIIVNEPILIQMEILELFDDVENFIYQHEKYTLTGRFS